MANTTNFTIEKPNVGGARNQWGGLQNLAIDKIDELLARALPVGTIQMYAKSTAPVSTTNGGTWLVCDGTAISRTTYAGLFTVIGTTYGSGDNSTTFNIPDMRARAPVGYNAGALNTGTVNVRSARNIATTSGGTEWHILTTAELAAHSHAIPADPHSHTIVDKTHAHTGLRSDGGAGTEDTSITPVDPGHTHNFEAVQSWGSSVDYRPEWGPGPTIVDITTESKTTGITIPDHKHTFDTNLVPTGITETENAVITITSTSPDTGASSSHNNMPPYLVINYIILAAHPSF